MKKANKHPVKSLDLSDDKILLELAERIRLRGNFITDHTHSEDKISNLRCMIEEIMDGRPKPFSIMESYTDYLSFYKDPAARLKKENELTFFAEAIDANGISICGYEFGLDETIKFRDWLNSAIEWLQKQKGNSDG